MSCEAHRLAGSSSGFFSIDPDGSGPLTHTVVYCNMSGEGIRTRTSTHAHAHLHTDIKDITLLVWVCVYCVCFMCPEEKVWMVIGHNSSKPVSVRGSSFQKPHIMKLNYSASLQQLATLLHRAQHCQQEVAYRCRKSRLFNTWGRGE